jgi:tetratricopeptide (TPR) repeat protein
VIFGGGFVYDDIVVIRDNDFLRSWSGLLQILGGHVDSEGLLDGTYRPLFLSFLSMAGRLFSFSPELLRFTTLLLHALNAWLLAGLAKRLFRLGTFPALLAATAAAALTSLLLFQTRPVAALLPFLLAFGFKESAMAIPLLWISVLPLLQPKPGRKHACVIAAGLLLSFCYYRYALPRVPYTPAEASVPLGRLSYFVTEIPVLWMYVKAFFNPYLLTIDRRVTMADPVHWWGIWMALGAGAALIAAYLAAFKRASRELVAFFLGLAWLVPTSTFQPLSLLYDETRCYLTIGAFGLFLASIFTRFPRPMGASNRAAAVFLAGFALLLSTFTLYQSTRFASESALWSAALDVDPNSPRANYHLGLAAQKARALDQAEAYYRRALDFGPNMNAARLNLGVVLGQRGKLDEAEGMFRGLIGVSPGWSALGHYHLGLGAMYRGETQEAMRRFHLADKADPEAAAGAKGRAIVLAREGREKEALAAWSEYARSPRRTRDELVHVPKELKRLVPVPTAR